MINGTTTFKFIVIVVHTYSDFQQKISQIKGGRWCSWWKRSLGKCGFHWRFVNWKTKNCLLSCNSRFKIWKNLSSAWPCHMFSSPPKNSGWMLALFLWLEATETVSKNLLLPEVCQLHLCLEMHILRCLLILYKCHEVSR